MKSNTQIELCRNFEKLKMIHKQELHSLQPNDKPSAEIKIEIAFIDKIWNSHITYVRLLYEILTEKSLVTREQNHKH